MSRWDYSVIAIAWERRLRDYAARAADGSRLEGLDAIVNAHGADGWELVALLPDDHPRHSAHAAAWHWRAIYKRRRPATEDADVDLGR
jgi:hypothetical protein